MVNSLIYPPSFFLMTNLEDQIVSSSARQQQRICWRYCTEPEFEVPAEVSQDTRLNLIVLGRTGDGKSSLLNDLMGSQVFKQKISAKVKRGEGRKK